ncbi:hypothetical protein ACH5RR_001861 [Cinchona calisaya]|uniref:K Homology domain-containing protein n=1 Tax=Cinchona calisaya TaxID=153742 RepID=A0ABD3B4N1_9GENT
MFSSGAMENRMAAGSYFQYSPSGVHSPLHRSSAISDQERYLADLFAERRTLRPFIPILPICSRLLNKEIMRMSGLVSNHFLDHEPMGHEHPYGSLGQQPNGLMNVEAWNAMGTEENRLLQKLAPLQTSPLDWHSAPGTVTTPIVKRVIRMDVPVDKFPNYNFVGRILGPRGNSLKRIEAMTECRIYIRGQGSVKDSLKEEKLKDKPGYEHLNEPLHILLEAEFPEHIINARVDRAVDILEKLLKPVDESMDVYKKQQLRELAVLNGTLREESPIMSSSMSPSMSPFNSTGMKRAKTVR